MEKEKKNKTGIGSRPEGQGKTRGRKQVMDREPESGIL